jgi:hypothetical protein
MTATPNLIDALVERATPVRRLRAPLVRACLWLGFAWIVLALLTVAHGVRTDLVEHLRQPVFLVSLAAALASGVLAAIAAFMLSLPDRSQWWGLLPAPALAVWLSTIGYGCLTDWVSMDPSGVRLGETVRCFATLLLTSVPLSLAMLVMLRYATLRCAVAGEGSCGKEPRSSASRLHLFQRCPRSSRLPPPPARTPSARSPGPRMHRPGSKAAKRMPQVQSQKSRKRKMGRPSSRDLA